ncbi:hypothetical protein [Microlunatus antarcticus]|uniref:Uncharacterized protein n=1 Tax=Microlunatus antarcticus TaxID=53388 RepID=A0A7W5JRT0_9ACTN|nr:hypothetical protein [Microlunatus antarcticus]MBB3325063.1 hypothetical protein [Microlunatus antarcticus]
MTAHSDWLGSVTVADSAFARAAFEKLDRLLTALQPAALDRLRSIARFDDTSAQIDLHHVSGKDWLDVDLHYSEDLGGMFNPLGHEEYYQLRGDLSVEQDALDDLAVLLTSTYAIEETWWRGRHIRTVVKQTSGGEEIGVSVSGWPLLPPKWLLLPNQLTVRRDSLSYGGRLTSN